MKKLTVIGGGLAGCEAAWHAANRGVNVTLFEMKPNKYSPAHEHDGLAELVCSNSLRSNDSGSAPGLLKDEMRMLGSLIIEAADKTQVPAGSALAVDREAFSTYITSAIEGHKNITIVKEEILEVPVESEDHLTIIATGPLTSNDFAKAIGTLVGEEYLYFYDAIAPIIDVDSINFDIAYKGSRYGKGGDDYINCPMDEACYYSFIDELIKGDKIKTKDFEKERFFEGCMPIEVMAKRGKETLSFGPMKPVGLVDPRTEKRAYAVVQLRQENKSATMYNMVGFQTRLTYPEQKRILRMIPGLESATFLRNGSMHRNTYIHSPAHMLPTLQLKKRPSLMFAGQITGVEGYIESAASGILAGINAAYVAKEKNPIILPEATALGSLIKHITNQENDNFQPMNINFGLLPAIERVNGKKIKKADRKALRVSAALSAMERWLEERVV